MAVGSKIISFKTIYLVPHWTPPMQCLLGLDNPKFCDHVNLFNVYA